MPERQEEAGGCDTKDGAHITAQISGPGRKMDVETGLTFKSKFVRAHFKSTFITSFI